MSGGLAPTDSFSGADGSRVAAAAGQWRIQCPAGDEREYVGAQRERRIHLICHLDDTAAYRRDVSPDFTAARLLYDDDASTVTWNLLSKAGTSRYANWNFNSTAQIGNEYYGMDATGLRKPNGADDDGGSRSLAAGASQAHRVRIAAPGFPLNVTLGGSHPLPLLLDASTTSDGRVYEYPPGRSVRMPACIDTIWRGLRDVVRDVDQKPKAAPVAWNFRRIVLVADSQRTDMSAWLLPLRSRLIICRSVTPTPGGGARASHHVRVSRRLRRHQDCWSGRDRTDRGQNCAHQERVAGVRGRSCTVLKPRTYLQGRCGKTNRTRVPVDMFTATALRKLALPEHRWPVPG